MTEDPLHGLQLGQAGALESRRIFIRELIVDCQIGIHAFEQNRTQKVAINVDLYLAAGSGPRDDDIATVLDYDQIRENICRTAQARHYNLQETLVERIAAVCLEPDEVRAVRVSTEKREVYPDAKSVGYEIVRMKQR